MATNHHNWLATVLLLLLLLLLTSAPQICSFQTFPIFVASDIQRNRRIHVASTRRGGWRITHHVLVRKRASSSSALRGQNRNNDNNNNNKSSIDNNKDEVSGLIDAFDGLLSFLSRPLRLGPLQIPTLYPIILALVAIFTNLITLFWFTGTFVGFAYLGRRIVSQEDDDDDNNEYDKEDEETYEFNVVSGSALVPTDLFALLGAVVTTGLLAPPSVSSPTLSLVALDVNLQPRLPTVVVVLLVLAGVIGLSSISTVTRRNDNDDERDGTGIDDSDRFIEDSPNKRLMDLWDEKFDQNLKKDRQQRKK